MTGADHPPLVPYGALRLGEARALLGQTEQIHPDSATATRSLQALIDGLCGLSQTDALTGCANRRQFHAVLDAELDRVARSGDEALLLIIDIDHFKKINDEYGHNAGDQVLKQLAKRLGESIRPMDTLARYGGEEFAVVLPACHAAYGHAVAERIRKAVENMVVRINPVQEIKITVTVGGAYALQWIRSTRELWIERADQQLYIGKTEGRNRVEIESQPDSTVTAEEKNLLFLPALHVNTPWSGDWTVALSEPLDPTDSAH